VRRRWLVLSLVIIVVLFWLLWVGAKVTDRSSFCASCHFMKPFVENWESSSHVRVNCIDCHYERGFMGYIAGKLRLTGEMLRYWVGAYNVRPHARVSDQNCLFCHEEKAIEKTTLYKKKIPFSHVKHYGSLTREIELTCTTCHSQLVQGNHLAVDENACVLCHFTGVARGQPLGDCYRCHGPPKDQILVRGIVFNHSDYLKSGVDCLTCHVHVTRGSGDVPREKCFSCHVERFEEYGQTELVHRTHVTEQKLKCTDCHTELRHGKFEIAQALSPDCTACHGGRHSLQEEIYIGTGGSGVDPKPDPMFLAGVACSGCHQSRIEKVLERARVSTAATPEACVSCHGPSYNNLMQSWQQFVFEYLTELKEKLAGFDKRLSETDNERARQAQTFYDEAQKNLRLVEEDKSLGVHNIHYVDALLRRSEESLARAVAFLEGREYVAEGLLPKESQFGCSRCHVGVDRQLMASEPQKTYHKAHLRSYDCNACHAVKPAEHGQTLEAARNCTACHPPAERMATLEPQDCLQCHQAQIPTRSQLVKFPHDTHINFGFNCALCHENVNQLDHLGFLRFEKAVPKLGHDFCATCHKSDVPPEGSNCTKCHIKF